MRNCIHCGAVNREGVVFCDKCGVALVPVPLATRQIESSGSGSTVRAGTDLLSPEGTIVLHVNDTETPVVIQVRQEVILGRTVTPADGGITYVNLAPFGADEKGVSRQHARLLREERALYLLDLNSTNGTRLNGELVPAGVERRLHDGDELMLGRLSMSLYFKA